MTQMVLASLGKGLVGSDDTAGAPARAHKMKHGIFNEDLT